MYSVDDTLYGLVHEAILAFSFFLSFSQSGWIDESHTNIRTTPFPPLHRLRPTFDIQDGLL